MQLSGFLSLALTLVSAYILMSLLCTTINEFINILLKTRAKTLEQTVTALLDDPVLRQKFRDHGLITSMQSGASGGKDGDPPSYLEGRTFADAILGALEPNKPITAFAQLQGLISQLPPSGAKDAMTAALTTAEQDVTKARDGIATWFDDAMNRLSGVYVRRMKYLSLAMGFGLALALNVDTFELGKSTWDDRASVAAVEQLMQKQAETCPTDASGIQCQTQQIAAILSGLHTLPVGWLSFGPPPKVEKRSDEKTPATGAVVGQPADQQDKPIPPTPWDWFSWILLKLAGVGCTAFAISLGAPFWFDILQNIMSLRGTGKKPEPDPKADP